MDANKVLESELKALIGDLVFNNVADIVRNNFNEAHINEQAAKIQELEAKVKELETEDVPQPPELSEEVVKID